METEKVREAVVKFIREKVREANAEGAVLGISGGIDSALVAYLAVEALGKDKVLGIHLPELNLTPAEDVLDATEVSHQLGIEFKAIDISGILTTYLDNIPDGKKATAHAKGNLKARIRMSVLYYHANLLNRIVIGTGNKTELLLGYFTKHGDGGVDILPIGDMYKTDVWELSASMGIPEAIINKAPSAGLWSGQTDEKELGITYKEVDRFLSLLLEGETPDIAWNTVGITKEQADSVIRRIKMNDHKLKTPQVIDLSHLR
ncbi:NAD+ synthase [uncultured Methanomethylovorans sp.]|uniref:NAD+ synthase n=1 Tax=uncultured Methanomethylovorans sp. TaxID=183759 RepID=UPI002AA8D0FC|nr:NAD+ synthase [uncultured Methanomethylovorans sp.]